MVWVSRKIRWIRPIIHIFCIFNKENISINFEGIESSNYFYGNYQYGNTKLKCNSFNEYEDKLEENYVVWHHVGMVPQSKTEPRNSDNNEETS